jgi:midasin (ATPase involved in ribosome maturation)
LVLTPTRSWGNRRANGYQALAEDGYALLAERLRSEDERAVVRSVLERVLHVKLDMASVYAADAAAAQDALQTAMRSNAANDEMVRTGQSGARLGQCEAPRSALLLANAMRTTGLNHIMWITPK